MHLNHTKTISPTCSPWKKLSSMKLVPGVKKRLGTTALSNCKNSAQIYAEVGIQDMLGVGGCRVCLFLRVLSFFFKVVSLQIYFL